MRDWTLTNKTDRNTSLSRQCY